MRTGNMTELEPKTKLMTLADLDGRTRAAQAVKQTIGAIVSDLGGEQNISTAEHQLIERAAVTGAMCESLAARWLLGEPADPALFATLSNAERRLLETVGLRRRARDATPSLREYLTSKAAKPAESPSNQEPAT
ncbi:hypothetical protein ACT4MK_17815 [Bradyrhizobium barranii]|uniref:hypothetical protein n=1 Tax=Bradyrhizobium TaxID=374 RepID=UPI003390A662